MMSSEKKYWNKWYVVVLAFLLFQIVVVLFSFSLFQPAALTRSLRFVSYNFNKITSNGYL